MPSPRRDYDDEYDRPARRDDYDDRPSRRDDYDRPSRRGEDYDDRPSRRYDEDDYDDRPSRRRRGFECPYCGTTAQPYVRSQISQAGWVVVVVMLFVCAPLFFIGLLMTEEVRDCSECGMRLG